MNPDQKLKQYCIDSIVRLKSRHEPSIEDIMKETEELFNYITEGFAS